MAFRQRNRNNVTFQSTNTITKLPRKSNTNKSYRSSVTTSSTIQYEPGSKVAFHLKDDPYATWCCPCPSGPPPNGRVNMILCDFCGSYGHVKCYGLDDLTKTEMRKYTHCCTDCDNQTGDALSTKKPPDDTTTSTTTNTNTLDSAPDDRSNLLYEAVIGPTGRSLNTISHPQNSSIIHKLLH